MTQCYLSYMMCGFNIKQWYNQMSERGPIEVLTITQLVFRSRHWYYREACNWRHHLPNIIQHNIANNVTNNIITAIIITGGGGPAQFFWHLFISAFSVQNANNYRTRVRSLVMLVSDSLPPSLTHSVTFSKLDWCDPGVWRCQLKTCWGCYCCRCWWWGSW